MKIYLNSIRGLDDAMVSMLMSKKSWTREKELEIRNELKKNTNYNDGSVYHNISKPVFIGQMDKLIKYGVVQNHTTLLRFIDLSFTVEGLHRGATD